MLTIVLPCYNEEKGIITFLKTLDEALSQIKADFSVVVVDDGSTDNTVTLLKPFKFTSSNAIFHLLKMKFNAGHQIAIYNGLRFVLDTPTENVIVMDSDGEDDPAALALLIEKRDFDIVEVKRGRRNESIAFKLLYLAYKLLFKLITGKSMNYGNYTMVKTQLLEQLRYDSFIHYPAYLLKLKGSRSHIRYDRAKRIEGKSKMGWHGLFIHSFKSLVEFGEQLLMLFLKLFVVLSAIITVLIFSVLYKKIIGVAIVGWTSTVLIGLFSLAIISLGFFILGILFLQVINKRQVLQQGSVFTKIV